MSTADVQPTQDVDQAPHIQGTLSVQEAATHFGVTEKTIRRRIKAGSLQAIKHGIAEGFEWRVYPEASLDSTKGTQSTQEGTHTEQELHATPPGQSEPSQQSAELLRALEVVERLTIRNEQLAGQLGFTQAKLQEAERTVALLMAPTDDPVDVTLADDDPDWQGIAQALEERVKRLEEPKPPAQPEPRVSWWKRLFG